MEKARDQKITNEDKLRVLGESFWKLSAAYGLTQKEQACILGLKDNRQRLNSLKASSKIPDDIDKMTRVANLAGIHKNLRILFPNNREVVYQWLKTPRSLFAGKSAMQYILDSDNSYRAVFEVRRLLDQLRVAS